MSARAQILFWLGMLAVVLLSMWLLGDAMTPFIAGLVLAYFLDPLADWLERLGLPRIVATTVIMLVMVVVFVVMLLALVPLLAEQVAQFLDNLPGYVSALARLFDENAPQWLKDALARTSLQKETGAAEMAARAGQWLVVMARSLWNGSMALFNLLSLLVITPIVLFYMLNDWDRMVAAVDRWVPRQHAETVRAIARDLDAALAGFIRGQGTVCLLLGTFYAVLLVASGLHFGLMIGLVSGFLSFIPYVGSTIGGILSIGMALVQFWPDWMHVLVIAGIFGLGQFIEGNFLTPNLVGGRVGVHPVWMMFALVAFGYLFGFVGLLLAVPLAAAGRGLLQHALHTYLGSSLYLGGSASATNASDTGGTASAGSDEAGGNGGGA